MPANVTGGPAAGEPGEGAGTSYYAAVVRAARSPERGYARMTRTAPAVDAVDAVDAARRRVLSGPEAKRAAALAVGGTASDGRLLTAVTARHELTRRDQLTPPGSARSA